MGYCDACNNTGWLDCDCGGDLCICDNNGEYECPHCDGMAGEYDAGLWADEDDGA